MKKHIIYLLVSGFALLSNMALTSCSDDDVEVWTSLRGLVQKLVVGRLCRCRWVAIVKDVARHEEGIGLMRS